ncbi:hypothetical protein POPTR_010G046350v4 [Populus trichocarpa]|uniref:Uncharacterized protein n=1 Tax=Populus trichocarpa TaxID=3694 RepID=A0ACC0SB57_POPTR|nr:hypothetical protein BDE02_10G040000 [Populus trichocarpa]KAI9386588.1 hypothetical protein POPTR_010G046350v4 [Populus trichocarpa]
MVHSFVWTRVISTRVTKNSNKAPTRYNLKESLSRNNLHVKKIFEAEYIAKICLIMVLTDSHIFLD